MKKNLFFTVLFLSLSLLYFSFSKTGIKASSLAASAKTFKPTSSATVLPDSVHTSLSETLYTNLNLAKAGLCEEAVASAVKGYEKLVDKGVVNNTQYLTIVDFSQSGRKKRFYLLDMENQQLVWNTFVSHGKNSGIDMADKFSNTPNSEQSSLGFYITKGTYTGKHGTSLRLAGQEAGFNSNAESRGIVVHGAAYVNKNRVYSAFMGRSQGCPALPETEYAQIINLIKGGTVMFIYHPTKKYLQHSRLLNDQA